MRKAIAGYSRYEVDESGHVFSSISNRELHPSPDDRGYMGVELISDEGISKRLLVHRLVAQAFLPNENNYPQVNHKDENPGNNHVSNLEWCTSKYNMNYGTAPERRRRSMDPFYKSDKIKELARRNGKAVSKVVCQFAKDGSFVARFESAKAAARATGVNHSRIIGCCTGEKYRKTAGGYVWKYERSEDLSAFQY